jgi:hypothetical protein
MKNSNTVSLKITLPIELAEMLRARATANLRTPSQEIRHLLKQTAPPAVIPLYRRPWSAP